ncbi:HAMP domain-containing protein [Thiospirochaeta perfilievii]|uniref:HAMP domain-containing protein n=1 Tax=Thiospirochaeta perfilievii TaxID=252967 RepID=A0A5C1Q8J7_9SPIO|nr:sensor histidine kinase [Thiospirochaeta perfilievii]QEN04375.1 HAMP domain-containing protein [Thiospirochaeta perfilievii]
MDKIRNLCKYNYMQNRLLRTFNDLGLRGKMVISFLILIILPFTFITSFMVQHFRDIMIDKAYNQSLENMVRSKSSTTEALQRALTISDKVSLMYTIGDIVNREYQSSLEVFKTYREFTTFREYINDYPEITAIKIYVDNNTMLNNWEFIPVNNEIINRAWYKRALGSNGQNTWLSFSDITKKNNTNLSLVRTLYFKEHGNYAVLVIDIDTKRLNNLFSKESYETFIVDEYGKIISTNNAGRKSNSYYEFEEEFPNLREAKGQYNILIDNKKYHMIVDDITTENSSNGVKIFSIFSVSSIIEEANEVWLFGFRSIILLVIIASLALYILYSILVRRLIRVQESMDIVANGHFHSFIEIDGKDEIGKLAHHFNNMVKNINRLVTQIDITNRQKRALENHQNEIKLQMLASQINPHFLFNSLEAIRMKAHMDSQPEIANIVKQLGRLMRRVLEVEGSWFSLKNELEIIKSFLEIEKFRLDSNFDYYIDVEDECLEVMMPPLLIQPLIENALIHGIEKKPGEGN